MAPFCRPPPGALFFLAPRRPNDVAPIYKRARLMMCARTASCGAPGAPQDRRPRLAKLGAIIEPVTSVGARARRPLGARPRPIELPRAALYARALSPARPLIGPLGGACRRARAPATPPISLMMSPGRPGAAGRQVSSRRAQLASGRWALIWRARSLVFMRRRDRAPKPLRPGESSGPAGCLGKWRAGSGGAARPRPASSRAWRRLVARAPTR